MFHGKPLYFDWAIFKKMMLVIGNIIIFPWGKSSFFTIINEKFDIFLTISMAIYQSVINLGRTSRMTSDSYG